MRQRLRVSTITRAFLLAALAVPASARPEGLSLYLEPDYSHTTETLTDQSGKTTSTTTDEFAQHYRLSYSQRLAPTLRLDAIGLFDRIYDWIDADGGSSRSDIWRAGGYAYLRFGPPVLNGQVGYERHDESTGTSLASGRQHTISERYSATANWRPADWPSLVLTLSRKDDHDADRTTTDSTLDEVIVSSDYQAFRQLRLNYSFDYAHTTNRITTTETQAVLNTAGAMYSDTFNGGHTSVVATYRFSGRTANTSTSGPAGTVAIPQLPSAGLSLVETFAAIPERDTLLQNPGLVDGNVTAAASINVGYSVSRGGDTNLRDLGLQFTDPTTTVNTLYVWVDRQLPVEIAGAYTWAAYRSDDNITWTRVNVVGLVAFSAFDNRFEISIESTQSRYLKVVTRPLGPAVTADGRFADVFVTEMQAYQIVAAQSVRGTISTTTHTATGAFHQQLLAQPLLRYDMSAVLTTGTGTTTYVVTNALNLDHRLSPAVALSATLGRQDNGQESAGAGFHTGAYQYTASMLASWLPALTDTLTYTGQYVQSARGTSSINTLMLLNRAQLYSGVDLFLSAAYNYNWLETGGLSQGPTVIATLSAAPNRALTLSTTYFLSSTRVSGGNLPDQQSDLERIDGTVSYTPFAALYLSATVSRITKGPTPTTLLTVSGSFSPFPDGTVLLNSSYAETLDTAQHLRTGTGNVGLRWNIRAGSFLDVGYTLIDNTSDAGAARIRSFATSLVVQL